MLAEVTSFLIQKKSCVLPCIGEFKVTTHSAEFDSSTMKMLPPSDEIIFNYAENSKISADLIAYVARKKSLDLETAVIYLKNYCEEWRNEIAKGGEINFKSFGTLQKNEVGNIYFKPVHQPEYKKPVKVEQLYGGTSTSTTEVTNPAIIADPDYSDNTEVERPGKSWWIWAIILFVIAAAAIGFHFYRTGFSLSKTGMSNKVEIRSGNIETISREVSK